jgi:enamine deaminase RidA (YjgF/YER057c/UK114 family)
MADVTVAATLPTDMSVSPSGAIQRGDPIKELRGRAAPGVTRPPLVVLGDRPNPGEPAEFSCVNLGESSRVSLMLVPRSRGPFGEQFREILLKAKAILQQQPWPMTVTLQTLFLRNAADHPECERLLTAHFGVESPVTNYVLQPPCCGAAVTLEAWAIGGDSVRLERFGAHALAVAYDNIRWVYCGGLQPGKTGADAYAQMASLLDRMRATLGGAATDFEDVVRTWFYLGGITEPEGATQRYMEMNRARADFYRDINFGRSLLDADGLHGIYPASTGIGMRGTHLVGGCLALQTRREDAVLVHLENPQQTPAYAYHSRYSPQSPRFSRGMALVLGDYVTTWISGTASILNSESRHPGNIEWQTEQTIDNIERLIARDNFAAHGLNRGGARLQDLAKIRVYLKRLEDFPRCKAICESRFGRAPAIYAVADICRPELLVEIEGVAFSPCSPD